MARQTRFGRYMAIAMGLLVINHTSACYARASVNGSMELVSDYRYRGQSLSGHRAALQSEITLELPKGLYVEFWTSTIEPEFSNGQEIDITAGDDVSLTKHLSVSAAIERFIYPGSTAYQDYLQIPIIVSYVDGSNHIYFGWEFAPAQKGTSLRRDSYLYMRYENEVSDKIGFVMSIGREDEKYLNNKVDWMIAERLRFKRVELTFGYVGFYNKKLGGTPTLSFSLKF